MLGFTPFKRHPNKFNYIPRYYDPEKEAREQRRAELRGERAEDAEQIYISECFLVFHGKTRSFPTGLFVRPFSDIVAHSGAACQADGG